MFPANTNRFSYCKTPILEKHAPVLAGDTREVKKTILAGVLE